MEGECRLARVTESGPGGVSTIGGGEERSLLPLARPWGLDGLPAAGDRVLLVPFEDTYVCLGVAGIPETPAGELHLSNGPGYIHFRRDGTIVINGLVVTPEGKIGGEGL